MSLISEHTSEFKAALHINANSNGYVTKDKINVILSSLGEPVEVSEVDKMIAVADVDGKENLI